MRALLPLHVSNGLRRIGLVGVFLAIACQLALGAMVAPDGARAGRGADPLAVLLATAIHCQGDGRSSDDGAPDRRHAMDGATCPAGIAVAAPALVAGADPAPRIKRALVAWRPGAAPGDRTAPPSRPPRLTARGPPNSAEA